MFNQALDRDGYALYYTCIVVSECVLLQVLHHDIVCGTGDGREEIPFIPPQSVVRWTRKRTAMKIKVTPPSPPPSLSHSSRCT